jgi:tryptophan synthase alpha chain
LGVPFSDPMADGPAVQASSQRALKAGMTVPKVLEIVRRFRKSDAATPIVLMGYYNPIHAFGTARFAKEAAAAGVDGLITVDLPPEEDEVLRTSANAHGIDIVRLATPTSDAHRLETILNGAAGFLYYVSIAGVTGTKTVTASDVEAALARVREQSALPLAVGFGIKMSEQARAIARFADAVVVGSAIVSCMADAGKSKQTQTLAVDSVLAFCRGLAKAVHGARTAVRVVP